MSARAKRNGKPAPSVMLPACRRSVDEVLAELADRDLLELAERTARRFGLHAAEMLEASNFRPRPLARATFCRELQRIYGWGNAQIGRIIGRDHSSVSAMLRRSDMPPPEELA